ncbi:hypothetical protein NL676_035390 [Syzygium grande]|nr:hypothetical protein NL676_035390 [Syzygium grande]
MNGALEDEQPHRDFNAYFQIHQIDVDRAVTKSNTENNPATETSEFPPLLLPVYKILEDLKDFPEEKARRIVPVLIRKRESVLLLRSAAQASTSLPVQTYFKTRTSTGELWKPARRGQPRERRGGESHRKFVQNEGEKPERTPKESNSNLERNRGSRGGSIGGCRRTNASRLIPGRVRICSRRSGGQRETTKRGPATEVAGRRRRRRKRRNR